MNIITIMKGGFIVGLLYLTGLLQQHDRKNLLTHCSEAFEVNVKSGLEHIPYILLYL